MDSGHDSASGFRMRKGAHLPHWTQEGAVYSTTFRLSDSLPKSVLERWKRERDTLLRAASDAGRQLTPEEERQLKLLFSEKIELYLDQGYGECWLKRDEIAEVVANALLYFEGTRYRLVAWSVMPNHVHAIFQPLGEHVVERILHSWKSYTSKECNKRLNRSGQFWNIEYYDHIIRGEEELRRQIEYVLNNPIKAGLYNWKWVGCNLEGITFTP